MIKILILIFLFGFVIVGYADTLYLKNGRTIEGIIKSEDNNTVELEVSGGVVKFQKNEINSISRSSTGESAALRQKWEKNRLETRGRISQQKREEEVKPKEVEFSKDSLGIIVRATLNKKVEADLVLDTGATLTMIRKNVAEKLGINVDRLKPDLKSILADGRQVNAKYIVLDSVRVENSESENVEACILLDDVAGQEMYDGLLGMSFLKRFNFKIDHKEKKLILEKL